MKRIIDETRSSGKYKAATTTIFWCFDDATVTTFVNLLSIIQDSDTFDEKTKHEANVFLRKVF